MAVGAGNGYRQCSALAARLRQIQGLITAFSAAISLLVVGLNVAVRLDGLIQRGCSLSSVCIFFRANRF
jgi:hypothetical protein